MAPTHLANGYCTLRERNQRMPNTATSPGSKKAPIPKNCNRTSEAIAPTIPIQLRAARVSVSTEALFSDGSSGEYETTARKRRSAQTQRTNPISSFSRRLPVGRKTLERRLMLA